MLYQGTVQDREDLYHRLNVVAIEISPLRMRIDGIKNLVDFFIKKHCASTKQSLKQISVDALEPLKHYGWPANVRELENAIERAVVLTNESTICPEDLPEQIIESLMMLATPCHQDKHG